METENLRVLLVEDNPADVRLLQEAFKETGFVGDIMVAQDGSKALDLLLSHDDTTSLTRPNLIILDLNLPRISGLSVLAEIKKESRLRIIPVIILSTSNAPTDVAAAENLGASHYLSKAVDFAGTLKLAQAIGDFCRRLKTAQ